MLIYSHLMYSFRIGNFQNIVLLHIPCHQNKKYPVLRYHFLEMDSDLDYSDADFPLYVSTKDMSFGNGFGIELPSFLCCTQQGTPREQVSSPSSYALQPVLEYETSSSSGYEVSSQPRRIHRRLGGEWSVEEDTLLEKLVGSGTKLNWTSIAMQIHREVQDSPLRSASQCNQRWSRVLNPSIKKGKWSQEEDDKLVSAINSTTPRRWKAIADKIQGRTDIQVRYRLKAIGERLVRQKLISRECLPE